MPVLQSFVTFGLLILIGLFSAGTGAKGSQAVFERSEYAVFQIRVVNRETGKKSSIGSGFIFGRADRLATNYHVVSGYIDKPETYRLRYLAADGREGDLALVAVDAVHDLALVESPEALGEPLLIGQPPPKGANLYAMGNPLDLGLTIASGTNGGILSQTDESRILFSGSLNPGMSGGPTFDDDGRVVGINVSTARNDISFIVPSRFLDDLAAQQPVTGDLRALIGEQISLYQQRYLEAITDGTWQATTVRQMQVPGVISDTIRCWDASPKKKDTQLYRRFSVSCKNENEIYLTDKLEVGKILYEYIWIESDELETLRFHRAYQSLNSSQFGGRAGKDEVERFDCSTRFVDINGQPFKATLCSRSYRNYPQLSDILFTAAKVDTERTGFIFNLDLSGTDPAAAIRLITRLLKEIRWQP